MYSHVEYAKKKNDRQHIMQQQIDITQCNQASTCYKLLLPSRIHIYTELTRTYADNNILTHWGRVMHIWRLEISRYSCYVMYILLIGPLIFFLISKLCVPVVPKLINKSAECQMITTMNRLIELDHNSLRNFRNWPILIDEIALRAVNNRL